MAWKNIETFTSLVKSMRLSFLRALEVVLIDAMLLGLGQ